jgi:hypothetical protein
MIFTVDSECNDQCESIDILGVRAQSIQSEGSKVRAKDEFAHFENTLSVTRVSITKTGGFLKNPKIDAAGDARGTVILLVYLSVVR